MIRRTILVGAVAAMLGLAASFGLAGCTTGHAAASPPGADAGADISVGTTFYTSGNRQPAPALTGTLLDGTSFSLAKQQGHVVVVNFWGAWCGSCRVETADLQAVHTATESTGVFFLGVDIQDDHDAATSYVTANHVTYPSIFDPAGRTVLNFAAVPPSAIPSTLVIDATGKIASIHIGAITDKELTGMIAQASG